MSKHRGYRGCVFVLSLCLAFSTGEVYLRFHPELYSQGYRASKNQQLIYELEPQYTIPSLGSRINEQGNFDKVYSVKKRPGIYRVAVVGDSISFGFGVKMDETFPKVLESELNRQFPDRFEVINFSVPGYNTTQESEIFDDKVLKFGPDLLYLNFCQNDLHLPNYLNPTDNFANTIFHGSYLVHLLLWKFDNFWRRHSLGEKLYAMFKREILGMHYFNERIYPAPGLEAAVMTGNHFADLPELAPERYRDMVGLLNYRRALQRIIRSARYSKIAMLSGLYNASEVIDRIQNEEGMGERIRISTIELASTHGYISSDLLLPDGGHLSPLGHRLVGRMLVKPVLRIWERESGAIVLNLRS